MYHTMYLFKIKKICIHFSDCDARAIGEGIRTNNHLPLCHSEVMAYVDFMSALIDDGDSQGTVNRNDLVALWDQYVHVGPHEPEGKLALTCLSKRP